MMIRRILPALFVLAAPNLTLAQIPSEEDLFGEKAPEEKKPEDGKAPAARSEGEDALIDKLQIGGRLEIRNSSSQLEDQRFQEGPYNQNKTADVYFDSRPNKDVRVFFRTRFYESSTARSTTNTPADQGADTPTTTENRGVQSITQSIDELWFKWDIDDTLFITAGKQHLKWGRGRFWNPTDFTAVETRDPFAQFDRRLGTELLKLHWPFEKSGHNLYAVFQFDDVNRNDDVGMALRGEFAFGSSGETAFSLHSRRSEPTRLGWDLGTGLGPIDLNLETVFSKNDNRDFYRGDLDVPTLRLPEAYKKDDKVLNQSVLNVEYTSKYNDGDNITFGLEGFYNELGYDDRELEFFSLVTGTSKTLYAGRRYAGAYIFLPQPGDWNDSRFYFFAMGNLSDKTSQARLTGSWTIYKQINLEANLVRCFGEYGELCFKVPESIVNDPNYQALPAIIREPVDRLPKEYSDFIASGAITMVF